MTDRDAVRQEHRHVSSLFMLQQTEIALPAEWQMTLGVWFGLIEGWRRLRKWRDSSSVIISSFASAWLDFTMSNISEDFHLTEANASNKRRVWCAYYHHRRWRTGGCYGAACSPTYIWRMSVVQSGRVEWVRRDGWDWFYLENSLVMMYSVSTGVGDEMWGAFFLHHPFAHSTTEHFECFERFTHAFMQQRLWHTCLFMQVNKKWMWSWFVDVPICLVSPSTDTCALGIGQYRVPIQYQYLINTLYASLRRGGWDHSFMSKVSSGLN